MKVAVISTSVFALGPTGAIGYSGLEHLAWLQAKGLAEKGHQVALVAPEGSVCPGVTIIPTGPAGHGDEKKSYGTYWQHLPQFDVILDNSWSKFSYTLKMEGKLKAPILGICHAPVDTMFRSPPPVDKPCIVCISEDQRNHFEALFNKPARTCLNGIDLDFYKPLGLPRTDRFLFLARFSTIKGPDLVIEACRQAGVGLDLIGDFSITNEPELLKHCQQLADDASVIRNPSRMSTAALESGAVEELPEPSARRIRMIGPCTRAETVYWYSQAHCMLHPNQRFREPFGLAPVEAMACGCPVIAWDNGAMRETVGTCGPGYLVKTMPEFIETVKRFSPKQASITTGEREVYREKASQFSVERMILRYQDLANEAVTTGGW